MSILSLLLRLALIGMAAALATTAAVAFSGFGHRWADILAQFTAPAFAGAVVITAAALFVGDRIATAACALCLALTAGAAWPQWFPARPQMADGPSVRLYSANVWVRNSDAEALGRSITAADPDVVVLLEVNDALFARLDQALPDHPHRAVSQHMSFRGPVRQLVASRTPLRRITGEPAPLGIAARVETALGPVTVVPTHLTRPWPFQIQWEQIRQAATQTDFARATDGPVILAGDFNSVSTARIGRQIRADGGVTPAAGWPGTWPAVLPAPFRMTIDQVYVSRDLAVADRRLGRANGSDHSPVITEIRRAR